jgi:hypothetical protein
VQFGLAGKRLWQRRNPLRDGLQAVPAFFPVRPELVAQIKHSGAAIPAKVVLGVQPYLWDDPRPFVEACFEEHPGPLG